MTITPKNAIIVTDLDGTFLTNDGRPTNQNPNLPSIKEFKKDGGRFTVATGRYGSRFGELFPEYREFVNAPAIMCNGAYLMDCSDGRIISETLQPYSAIKPLIDEVLFMNEDVEIKVICRDSTDVRMCSPVGLDIQEFYKCVLYGKKEAIDYVAEVIKKKHPDEYTFVKSCATIFEILNPKATKGTAIGNLKEYFKASGEEAVIIAAGDYENDIEMLKCADVAICPSNAIDSVKSICKYVLKSNNEGTIAHLIDKINKGEIEV